MQTRIFTNNIVDDTIEIPEAFAGNRYATHHFYNIALFAKRNHPFYRDRITDKVPIITRRDILDSNDILLNNHPVTAKTSGSTGVAVKLSWDYDRTEIERLSTERFVSWLGGRLPVSNIIYLEKPRANAIDIFEPVSTQIDFIKSRYKENGCIALSTYPSNAERLCKAILERNEKMSFIKRIGIFGEVFETYLEKLINETFPEAQVWSSYSSQEFGIIAGRCPHAPDFHHIFAGKLGVEILDENDNQCQPGQIGRLVITDFFNTRSPFIRYDIGDLAAPAACSCSKIPLPSISQILGKARGSLLHKNGERIPFTHLSVAIRDTEGIIQNQVIQKGITEFIVRLVVLPDANIVKLQDNIRAAFREHFNYSCNIYFQFENNINREKNGKFYASICEI